MLFMPAALPSLLLHDVDAFAAALRH